jgi:hypothetical protein
MSIIQRIKFVSTIVEDMGIFGREIKIKVPLLPPPIRAIARRPTILVVVIDANKHHPLLKSTDNFNQKASI